MQAGWFWSKLSLHIHKATTSRQPDYVMDQEEELC